MLASNPQGPEIVLKHSSLPKASIVVSKNVAKKAVDRNRIKRVVKEALRQLKLREQPAIIVRTNLANLKTQQIKDKLAKLIKNDKNS